MDAIDAWLRTTPLLVIAGILMATVIVSLYAGAHLRTKLRRFPEESDTLLVSAVLSLLALLLSFTFSLATDRYETRRVLVQQEANAIGTAYLRTQLLDEPHRTRVSQLLVAYTDNRILLAGAEPDKIPDLLATNDRLLHEFWRASAAAFPTIRGLDFSSTFYESVNQVVDLDATRKSARMARVPPTIFIVLFVYVAVSACLLGYFAQSRRGLAQATLFLALLVLFLLVILDIDHPSGGGIRESQAPMERMRATLETY